jgi:hypothetical protein
MALLVQQMSVAKPLLTNFLNILSFSFQFSRNDLLFILVLHITYEYQ